MRPFFVRRALVLVIIFVVLGLSWYIFSSQQEPVVIDIIETNLSPKYVIIGSSVEGRKIEAYTFGDGEKNLLFVGGIHGGYEWNSVLLAYKFIDYLSDQDTDFLEGLSVTIIPSANPDGLYQVTKKEGRFVTTDILENLSNGTGRFNANAVDLNRNFDCNWQATSTWKGNIVSAGTIPFSEPEARALKDFIIKNNFKAAIFWHSQSNAVYASQCNGGILPLTTAIMNIYAKASNYPPVDVFDSYSITGAVEDWLAAIKIPAITVELQTHQNIEWERNLLGVKALFDYFRNN